MAPQLPDLQYRLAADKSAIPESTARNSHNKPITPSQSYSSSTSVGPSEALERASGRACLKRRMGGGEGGGEGGNGNGRHAR
jgi:hypothetical protein